MIKQINSFELLGVPIADISITETVELVANWITSSGVCRAVTFVNAHMLVEARSNPLLSYFLSTSDLNCPDGKPISWMGTVLQRKQIHQVCGPDFMPRFFADTVEKNYSHFIYGGAEGTAQMAAVNLQALYPGTRIAGTYSPPFRPLTDSEEADVCRLINESGANLVWVCLGCPKQEIWMHKFREVLHAQVLLGVGQAVDIVGGRSSRAPLWLREGGLEWLYRLMTNPRRLWKRYLRTNTLFLLFTLRSICASITSFRLVR